MKKLIIFTVLLSMSVSFAYANSNKLSEKLNITYKVLKENQLLLRHEVNAFIKDLNSAKGEHEYKRILNNLKRKSSYFARHAKDMNISKDSKIIIKRHFLDVSRLVDKSLQTHQGLTNNKNLEADHLLITMSSRLRTDRFRNKADLKTKPLKSQHTFSKPAHSKETKISDKGRSNFNEYINMLLMAGIVLISLVASFFYYQRRKVSSVKSRRSGTQGSNDYLSLAQRNGVLKLMHGLSYPAIIVGEKGKILWCNEMCERELNLLPGSIFDFNFEAIKETEQVYSYVSHKKLKYLIDRQSIDLIGEKGSLYLFINSHVDRKSFALTEDSQPLDYVFEETLANYNHLFSLANIPVCINQKQSNSYVDRNRKFALDKIVQLTYFLSKDLKDTRVDIVTESINNRQYIQIAIRGLQLKDIDFDQPIIFRNITTTVQSVIAEIELNFSQLEGRVILFDKQETGSVNLMFSYSEMTYLNDYEDFSSKQINC